MGGFGTALSSYSLNVGDPMRIVVLTSSGRAEYTTTAVEGSGTPPDSNGEAITSALAIIMISALAHADLSILSLLFLVEILMAFLLTLF